nr:uncharacterized protein LOC122268591 [Parasteatoda tepidariorum]
MESLFPRCILFLIFLSSLSTFQMAFGNTYTKNYEEELFERMARVYEILRRHFPTQIETTTSSTDNVNGVIQNETEFKTKTGSHKYKRKEAESIRTPLPKLKSIQKHNFRKTIKISPRTQNLMIANLDKHIEASQKINRRLSKEFKKHKLWPSGKRRGPLRATDSSRNHGQFSKMEKEQRRLWHPRGMRKNRFKQLRFNRPRKDKIYNQIMPKQFPKRRVKAQKRGEGTKALLSAIRGQSSPFLLNQTSHTVTGTKKSNGSLVYSDKSKNFKEQENQNPSGDKIVSTIDYPEKSTINYHSPNLTSHPFYLNQKSSYAIKGRKESNNSLVFPNEIKSFKEMEKHIKDKSENKPILEANHNQYMQNVNKVESREKHDVFSEKLDDLKESVQPQSKNSDFWKSPYFIGSLSGFAVLTVLVFLVVCVYSVGKVRMKKKRNKSSCVVNKHESLNKSEFASGFENNSENELSSVDRNRSLNRKSIQTNQDIHNRFSMNHETVSTGKLNNSSKFNSVNDKSSDFKHKPNTNPGKKLQELHGNFKMRQQKENILRKKPYPEATRIDKNKQCTEMMKPRSSSSDASHCVLDLVQSQNEASHSESVQNHSMSMAYSNEKLKEMLLYLDRNPLGSPHISNLDIRQTISNLLTLNESICESSERTPKGNTNHNAKEVTKRPKLLQSKNNESDLSKFEILSYLH